jgi:S-DNA-T family DNA segregation ATPase FtsK/SpoIIIE
MLVIDEFQELFVRDDRLAGDCAMLLDRLVRQGRSFGMHVVLSSQSLAGAYSLPRATLGQMAVRIAMQCSESDAALILSDDNTAARLITKPGEAIYNDAGGLIEGNQPFQVAWLSPTRHREILRWVATRDQPQTNRLGPAVIFEGNRPCRWSDALADAALAQKTRSGDLVGLLGESVAIGPPVAISLSPDAGRNVLVVASQPASTRVMLTIITAMIKSANQKLNLVLFDGSRKDKDDVSIADWMNDAGIDFQSIKPRGSEIEMVRISGLVKERLSRHENDDEDKTPPPLLVVIDSLDRFRDLRPDETYNFSLDAAAAETGSAALQAVLKDGPPAGVFVMVGISGAETFARWLPRSSQHDLELRILGQMNANDSAVLMDSPAASELTDATMILHDNADGQITKFRQCDLPAPKAVQAWMD